MDVFGNRGRGMAIVKLHACEIESQDWTSAGAIRSRRANDRKPGGAA